MAEVEAEGNVNPQEQQTENEEGGGKLKYLAFVQAAAAQAGEKASDLYQKAKDKSGPWKSGVESAEVLVKNVVGPVYGKFQDVPKEVLMFVDKKVDESVAKLDNRVPPVVKQASVQAYSVAREAPVAALAAASEVNNSGVKEAAKTLYSKYEPKAKELMTKLEPKAEEYAVSAWRKLNQLPYFCQVAKVVAPAARSCSELYNKTVRSTAEKGYAVSSYLPLVPTEKIANILSDDGAQKEVSSEPEKETSGDQSETSGAENLASVSV